jgi:hypothetical protein
MLIMTNETTTRYYTTGIVSCDMCPFADVERVHGADSFEQLRTIRCYRLGKIVHLYLDTWDKAPIPEECPLSKIGGI